MDEYIEYINQWSWIWKYIPCIRQIYLCNSITFNSLHNNSDIDICIITKSGYLWYARLFSRLYLTILNIKRSNGKYLENAKKFCLSFYIDEQQADIYHIRQRQWDIYLSYRLAHSVLLYTDDTLPDNFLISHNKKLLSYLPNHPLEQSIYLWNNIIRWNSFIKRGIELIMCNSIGRFFQKIISRIRWSGIMQYKRNKLSSHTKNNIIISDYMLKFHQDKRSIIQYKRKMFINKDL
jgi:predicted nucleotidyltransferase